ncbi:MAG TPA: DUF4416 family protein [Candidatus Omnitrophota bacterium]|nr:DUF4416 family protein [Candidatus Omnitrophota bacterium]HPN65985.1 DUF4416 family protein [Candidatus Omnitrophota bacterium]HRZ67374.1 DUF4416 family protein [Candidatus Omnitrophota bacterium]
MGAAKSHKLVKLVIGMISNEPDLIMKVEKQLEWKFGKIDFRTALLDFSYTDYYAPEMGQSLKRQFISFRKLVDPVILPKIKRLTNRMELRLSRENGKPSRRINIDPGYVTDAKLVLATTKDNAHRIYLNSGVFAEITLRYVDRSFSPWEWTYRDYQTREYVDIFNEIRKIYLHQAK